MTPQSPHSRQTFLGDHAELVLSRCLLGIVGLGGGGSQVSQQASHIGFQRIACFDFDRTDITNLNRLVGAQRQDANPDDPTPKGVIAKMLYHGLQPGGNFNWADAKWQEAREVLRSCDVVVACLDDIANRLDLEKTCRRYLIPLIDIGMDIEVAPGQRPKCYGQIATSIPGRHCFQCLGFHYQPDKPRYGDAGGRPQVIWPNGVLASTAIGIAMDMIMGWTGNREVTLRLQYDGNSHQVSPMRDYTQRLNFTCDHFPPWAVGDPTIVA